ncbi:MAG TPA: cysteine desulfurase family protein [Lacisediminihabitans sp.]|uniref:cysteine desulfurase family protein n=1 Tax=Lacisediminihabitans sp. TaxID=2787631 RepID=UPI002EDA8CD4
MIYLDSAATTAVRRDVLEAMWPYLTGDFGNPSSHHGLGESAAAALADARGRIAAVLGCRASEVVFTSGGTEGDNLAIKGIALASPRGRHIVTTTIEHQAVLEACDYLVRFHGFEVARLGVDADGLVDLDEVAEAIRPDTTLVTVMYANNEVGSIQPIGQIVAIAHELGVPVHTDAVQAAGALDLDVTRLGVDAMTISGHKLGAPKGVGALFVRGRIPLEPLMHGGGQERGRRSGTENVAGAVGLATALELATRAIDPSLVQTRDRLIAAVLGTVPGARLTGHPSARLPGNASFTFAGTSGEAVLLELERRGILCSSGSACAAGSDEPSHVLLAMGLDPALAQTAVRFTIADGLSPAELDEVTDAVRDSVAAVQQLTW